MTADRDTRRALAQAAALQRLGRPTPSTREPSWYTAAGGPLGALPDADLAHIAANDPAQILADLDALDRADRIEAAARALLAEDSAGEPWQAIVALRRALDGEA